MSPLMMAQSAVPVTLTSLLGSMTLSAVLTRNPRLRASSTVCQNSRECARFDWENWKAPEALVK